MHPTGPYRTEMAYAIARAMREHDIEPSLEAQRIGRMVADLQD